MLQNMQISYQDRRVTDSKLPLGQNSKYPKQYDPSVLFAIARSDSRAQLAGTAPPFHGCDIWNAWDLTWLRPSGTPVVATAEIRVPYDSANLVESKSLKLYLNSYAMTHFSDAAAVAVSMTGDLTKCAGGPVSVRVFQPADTESNTVAELPGTCIDSLAIRCDSYSIDEGLLAADFDKVVQEELHTHLLRSLCPVTAQPDIGSLGIYYQGPKIDPESLLRYVVSFREHNDFHEACVERMFMDIIKNCGCEKLSLHARFQRRGGLDINPFRSNFEDDPPDLRLWRQ
jgi:7-cyano-7-deazaguanine reductase